MNRLIALNGFLVAILCFYPAFAYSLDYFTADEDPINKNYLRVGDANHTDKIMVWLRQERIENAVSEVKYMLERFPNHPKVLMLGGLVAKINKTPSFLIPYYERALKLYPQYALTRAQYGSYLVDIGNPNAGIAKLKEAMKMDPKLVQAYVWLAKAYYQSGNPELGHQVAEQAVALGYKGKIH